MNENFCIRLSDQSVIRVKDFTDDRLEQALDYISKKEN